MGVNEVLAIMSLVERGVATTQTIMAMKESGVTDEQILASLQRLRDKHDRHQSLDLRKPV